MILILSFVALLIAGSADAQRIKGSRLLLQPNILGAPSIVQAVSAPVVQAPVVHDPIVHAPVVAAPIGKGGVLGKTVHHATVVEDPISGAPVVVEKISRVGGIKGGGIKGGRLAVAEVPFGTRHLYRIGQSSIPYGLMGSDYYSYPNSLLTAPRAKTVIANNLSGLRPVGYGTRIGGIKGGGLPVVNRFSALRPTYRSGISAVPYGLSGLDYFSYPNRPLALLRGPSKIGGLATGGLPAIGQSIVDPISQFSVADAQLHTNVFGLRRPIYRSGVSALPYGLTGLDYFSYPNRPLSRFGGLSKIGGLAVGGLAPVGHAPIVQEAVASPISQFSVDDAQHNLLSRPLYRTGVSSLPYGLTGLDYFSYPNRPLSRFGGLSKIGGLAAGGLAPVGHAPIVQEAVVSPISQFSVDDAQHNLLSRPLYRTGVSSLPYGLTGLDYFSYPNRPLSRFGGLSKIGGLAAGGLAPVGHAPIVQEAVVSPISQFSVDDAQHNLLSRPLYRTGVSSLPYGLTGHDYFSYPNRPLSLFGGLSKIGGLATGGIPAIGHAPIAAPISQVHQEHLGDSAVQTIVDPHDGEITQVKETLVEEPLTGEIHKVTEVTKGNLAQQNIADAIVQESISPALGGAGYGYSPRVSFLSQFPYDTPDAGLLRSVIARPVVQQHQVEQFHV